jgi:hypothetical protein
MKLFCINGEMGVTVLWENEGEKRGKGKIKGEGGIGERLFVFLSAITLLF